MSEAEPLNVKSFFDELLNRKILPKCSLVVTSRSYATENLKNIDLQVDIMGFTEIERYKFLEENTKKLKLENAKCHLENKLIIDSLCYIPLNMKIFVYLVENDLPLPKTQIEFIESFICLIITQKKKKCSKIDDLDPKMKDAILVIAEFAYEMNKKGQLVFTEEEIKKKNWFPYDQDCNAFGLLQSVVNQIGNKSYNFVHFSVQEFLAAYHISKWYFFWQKCEMEKKFWKYLGIWRMYNWRRKSCITNLFIKRKLCVL